MDGRDSPQLSSTSGAIPALLDSRLRHLGCALISSTSSLLGLPATTTLATAHVLLHRFFSAPSSSTSGPLRKHSLRDIALAALFLACKVEETQVSIKSLITVFHHVLTTWRASLTGDDPAQAPDPIRIASPEYTDYEHALLKSEMHLLKALGFDVHVDHAPDVYLWLMHFLRALDLLDQRHVAQSAWRLANDSFRLPLALFFPPHAIAAACVELAVRRAQVAVPGSWTEIVADVSRQDVEWIAQQLVAAGPEHVPLPVDLPITVGEIKAWLALDEEELRSRLVPSDEVGADELEARGRDRLLEAEKERKCRQAQEQEEDERKQQAAVRPKVDAAAVQAAVAKARAAAAAAAIRSSPLALSSSSTRDGYRDRDGGGRGSERYRDDLDERVSRNRERDRDRDRDRERDRDRSRRDYSSSSSRYGRESSTRSSSRGYRR